jgi:hypothetical protein
MQKVLLLLFTIGWGPLAAQTTEFFTVELGGGYTQLVDEPFSPLLYSGWSGHFILGNITERPRSEWSSRFQGGFGSLSASIDNGGRYATSSVTSYLFSFELANYRLVHTWGKGGLWLGGAWNTQFDLRMYNLFTNNIAGHELRSTLDVGTFFRYALTDRSIACKQVFNSHWWGLPPALITLGLLGLKKIWIRIFSACYSRMNSLVGTICGWYKRMCNGGGSKRTPIN